MNGAQRGFSLVEVTMSVAVVGLLVVVLTAMASRARNADGAAQSIMNVATIIKATQQYHADHNGQVPLRGAAYTGGMLNGWDSWNFGGKNCAIFWQSTSGGILDETGYSRFLNPYVFPVRIPKPNGYFSTGSGSTWNFNHGIPTVPQRASLQIPLFKSPGDVATRQRNWPSPTPGVSCYDDVGTSYLANMRWWGSIPGTFTQQFNEGTRRIGLAFGGANPNYVFMYDQIADVVSNGTTGTQIAGEFGKINSSACGFADGRAGFMRIVPGAISGPGYTFAP